MEAKKYFKIFIPVIIVLIFASCKKDFQGRDGLPGRAFLGLTWYDIEPQYIDIGNTDIPYKFYWDEFYRVYPGNYTLYYEVSFWEDNIHKLYAYEIVYDIWINSGELGGTNYHGRDGADTYFTLELCPEGPYIIEEEDFKSTGKTLKLEKELINIGEKNEIITQKNDFGMKVVYKRVEPRV